MNDKTVGRILAEALKRVPVKKHSKKRRGAGYTKRRISKRTGKSSSIRSKGL